MSNNWWLSILWIFGASLLGFLISFIFAGYLKCSRRLFLLFYILLGGIFMAAFICMSRIDILTYLSTNYLPGYLYGVLASFFLVRHVRAQPATRQSTGLKLAFDICWAGLIYGILDAVFLNIMPVLAIQAGFSNLSWADTFIGKVCLGFFAMLGSLLITLTYHLGYPEFRNTKIIKVLVGNSIMTLAVLLSSNPLGALVSHPVMHIAAVLQGPETTIQLPPHYQTQRNYNKES